MKLPSPTTEALQRMQKVELHCHLELALRMSTLRELAANQGHDVQKEGVFESEFLIQKPMGELRDVLHKFLNTRDVIVSEAWMERIAFEVCEDMYLESNVRILELRYAPSFLLDHHTTMRADRLQESIQRGVAKAEAMYPIAVGLICILQRTNSIEENARWVDFALNHRNGFVALDLADNEVDFDPEPFIPLFMRAKKGGLGITVHAGEPLIPGISKNIITAIDGMGADRIGHGLQAIENPELVEMLAHKGIPLELCPTSNWLTGATPSIETHPFRQLHAAGVQVTINTDDPGIMCTNLLREYHLLAFHQNIPVSVFEQCNAWAFEASFIDEAKRRSVWQTNTQCQQS
jgi:adenosine deaminase